MPKNNASYIKGIPDEQTIAETLAAVETCYPKKEFPGKIFITKYNLFTELIGHPKKYPGYAAAPSDRRRRRILHDVCIDELHYTLYSNGNRNKRNAGALIREE
jgi:hypothetical protein